MVQIGNHIKLTVSRELREQVRNFYTGICECEPIAGPRPDLDLYQFAGGFVVGVFFADKGEVLAASDQLKSAWLEIKVPDTSSFQSRLEKFGIERLPYEDVGRFYFQAPGGQVFRVAPLEGGI